MKQFDYKSVMQIPKIEQKICINQSVGKAVSDKKLIDSAVKWDFKMSMVKKAIATILRRIF